MTKTARIVLQDAKHALFKHTNNLQCEEFRISWFAVVGLLRAVGHALEKVDAKTSPAMRVAIQLKWKELNATRPEPSIFWGFIESERNRFLKNYEHGISRTLISRYTNGEKVILFDAANAQGAILSSGTEMESYIADGPFQGRHETEVAWKAHQWWERYLDEVDIAAEAQSAAELIDSSVGSLPNEGC